MVPKVVRSMIFNAIVGMTVARKRSLVEDLDTSKSQGLMKKGKKTEMTDENMVANLVVEAIQQPC